MGKVPKLLSLENRRGPAVRQAPISSNGGKTNPPARKKLVIYFVGAIRTQNCEIVNNILC